MNRMQTVLLILLPAMCGACASTAQEDARQVQRERDVEAILTETSDADAYVETKRCLSSNEYRDFTVLDDRRILFEGRRDRFYLSTLPSRCYDLRFASVLRVKSISSIGRICAMDSFMPGDWFDLPLQNTFYRRWPWTWGSRWHTGATCRLGEFQPLNEVQAANLKALFKQRRKSSGD